jgi:hypothetical protein
MALLVIVAGCAPAASQAFAPPAVRPAVLRLLDITPPDGEQVDSSTELVARLAYHIPDFDPAREYVITALFAQVGGGLSSQGGEDARVRDPYGIATIRRQIEPSRGMPRTEPTTPLTGVFFLLRSDSVPSVEDTVQLGNEVRIRRAATRSSVQARSRTFYYNGAGPARTLSTDLVGIVEEYWTYRQHRALAVAYESDRRWTYGYAYGYPSPEAAVARALEECRASATRREIATLCRIISSDEKGVEWPPSP